MSARIPAWKRERRILERVAVRIYQRYTRGGGYQAFGYDWPTFYTVAPLRARVYRSALSQIRALDAANAESGQ